MTTASARTEFFMETAYVARVYADSLRDNFVGYVPSNQPRFDALKAAFDAEVAKPQPYLATLLTIESDLLSVMPDDVVASRFWSLDDRFRRVVPLGTRDRYDASVVKRGDPCWSNPQFLRGQSRTLLDVIHSNYLINIGREKSIKRLKTIMGWAALAILCLLGAIAWISGAGLARALILLAGAGIFGSFLSITNRLQAAVSTDAMTQDGIYELTGLRVGWVGILMSFVLGGGFALVLYGIVMAGLLNEAIPMPETPPSSASSPGSTATTSTQPMPAPPASTASGQVPASAVGAASDPVPIATTTAVPATSNRARPGELHLRTAGTKLPSDRGAAPGSATTSRPIPSPSPSTSSPPRPEEPQRCAVADKRCANVGGSLAAALGLASGVDFFRMLLLAFLAGFAERLVPDILNRLSKQGGKES